MLLNTKSIIDKLLLQNDQSEEAESDGRKLRRGENLSFRRTNITTGNILHEIKKAIEPTTHNRSASSLLFGWGPTMYVCFMCGKTLFSSALLFSILEEYEWNVQLFVRPLLLSFYQKLGVERAMDAIFCIVHSKCRRYLAFTLCSSHCECVTGIRKSSGERQSELFPARSVEKQPLDANNAVWRAKGIIHIEELFYVFFYSSEAVAELCKKYHRDRRQ